MIAGVDNGPGRRTGIESLSDVTDARVEVEDAFVLSDSVAGPSVFYRLTHNPSLPVP